MKDLQQIKDEVAEEFGYKSNSVFNAYEQLLINPHGLTYKTLNEGADQVAIRYAQEQNRELVEILESMVDAWEALPYGHNSVKDTQNWISKDLHPNIIKMRKLIAKHKQTERR